MNVKKYTREQLQMFTLLGERIARGIVKRADGKKAIEVQKGDIIHQSSKALLKEIDKAKDEILQNGMDPSAGWIDAKKRTPLPGKNVLLLDAGETDPQSAYMGFYDKHRGFCSFENKEQDMPVYLWTEVPAL